MLIGFKVKNYRSFKELQHFSMLSGKVRNNENHVVECCKKKILKFSGVFGANGSGKSNLILAIGLAQSIIIDGIMTIINNQYFRGTDSNEKESSYFEFELALNEKLYSYGFEVNISRQEIISEWLIDMTKPTEKIIFERDVKHGKYSPLKTKNNYFDVCLAEMKNNNKDLFINEMARRISMSNNRDEFFNDIRAVFKFLIFDMYVIRPTSHKFLDIDYIKKKDKILKILKALDINITDIVADPCDIKNVQTKLPPMEFATIMNKFEESYKINPRTRATIRIENDLYVLEKNSSGEILVQSLNFIHENCESKFGAYDESDGTIRILELVDIMLTENKLFLIDELDSSLHPILVGGLLKIFLKANNTNQLIITTHELKTLDFDLVRRDEIWFAEKNEKGESRIYSLEEFKDVARFDRKIDKAYLEGRFGAIANIDTDYED